MKKSLVVMLLVFASAATIQQAVGQAGAQAAPAGQAAPSGQGLRKSPRSKTRLNTTRTSTRFSSRTQCRKRRLWKLSCRPIPIA